MTSFFLDNLDRFRLLAFAATDDAHAHRLAFVQGLQAGAAQGRHVDEHIAAAVVGHDKSETFVAVIPLDRAAHFGRRSAAGGVFFAPGAVKAAAASVRAVAESAFAAGAFFCRAGIDRSQLPHLAAFLALTDGAHHCRAVGQGLMAGLSDYGDMQKHIATAIFGDHKTKTFFRGKPFDCCFDRSGIIIIYSNHALQKELHKKSYIYQRNQGYTP